MSKRIVSIIISFLIIVLFSSCNERNTTYEDGENVTRYESGEISTEYEETVKFYKLGEETVDENDCNEDITYEINGNLITIYSKQDFQKVSVTAQIADIHEELATSTIELQLYKGDTVLTVSDFENNGEYCFTEETARFMQITISVEDVVDT